jgi:1,5-anhydro-D-fructose reductase (1,5-anhydro-D-mannitol-forming)
MTTPRRSADGPIGVAILGTGGIVRRSFAPAVKATAGARLAAVLSRDLARGRAFADEIGAAAAYDDVEALLRDPAVHALIVATPDAQHERQVIAAANAGVHVLCEKPMTSSPEGCRRMAEAVRRSGVTFAMGYSLRFSKRLQTIRELTQSGALGRVWFARALWTSKTAASQETWRTDRREAIHWAIGRVGTHLIDLYRWYFGEPSYVKGNITRPRDGGPNDELSTVILTFPTGVVAELTVSVLFPPGNSLEIYGEDGALLARDVLGYGATSQVTVKGEPVTLPANDPFTDEVADFVRAIRTGAAPMSGLDDGVRNVAIMAAAGVA